MENKLIHSLISVVVPCYNEEKVLDEFYKQVTQKLQAITTNYEIIFVNDGSKDNTQNIILTLSKLDSHIKFIEFSRNFGHQSALKAGLDLAKGDAVISMDSDLQHPPELLQTFIEKWQEGFEIVYTQRKSSKENSFFKNITSTFFYKILNYLSDTNFEDGIADFRLLDKKVIELIKQSKENNLFLRGYISWIGFKNYKIEYSPNARFAGTTKYSLKKMLSLAVNGITSFSIKPLRISVLAGSFISFLAFLYSMFSLYQYFFGNSVITGWTSVIISVLFIGGIQLIMLGIMGEYLGKLFEQTKQRPDYIITNTNLHV